MNKDMALRLSQIIEEIEPLRKNADNPFFKAKYADLAAVLRVVMPVVRKHGCFLTTTVDDNRSLRTALVHVESGDELVSSYPLTPKAGDPQAFGSAVTYGRRYILQNMFNLNAVDDDGETSMGRGKQKEKKRDVNKQEIADALWAAMSIDELKKRWTENMSAISGMSGPDKQELEDIKNTARNDLQRN